MNFKEYMGEATAQDFKAQGYGGTSEKTKFQVGDWVVIGDSQTKRGQKYIGQYGQIIGYRPYQMIVKYAVEFSDGEAEAFYGQMIFGPFKDEATAKKYSRPNTKTKFVLKIDPKDLRGYSNKALDTKPKLEAYMKGVVTSKPFNMTWLDKPLQFSSDKYIVTILASAPKPSWAKDIFLARKTPTKVVDSKLEDFLSKNICFFRQNNILNGKLVIENYVERLDGIFDGGYSTPYFINMPFFHVSNLGIIDDGSNLINFFDKTSFLQKIIGHIKKQKSSGIRIIAIETVGVPLSINKDVNELVRAYLRPMDILTGEYNAQELFDIYYKIKVEGDKKYLNSGITVNAETLPQFEGYYFNPHVTYRHNYKIVIEEPNLSKIKQIPQTLTQGSNIVLISGDKSNKPISSNPTIQNFNFIPKNINSLDIQDYTIQSFQGIPENIELQFTSCNLQSLNGLPKKLKRLEIEKTNLKSLRGGEDIVISGGFSIYNDKPWSGNYQKGYKIVQSLEGLPKANHYEVQGYTEQEIKKFIKDRELTKNLDPETKETWADVITNL